MYELYSSETFTDFLFGPLFQMAQNTTANTFYNKASMLNDLKIIHLNIVERPLQITEKSILKPFFFSNISG